jgi:hypothetical protein
MDDGLQARANFACRKTTLWVARHKRGPAAAFAMQHAMHRSLERSRRAFGEQHRQKSTGCVAQGRRTGSIPMITVDRPRIDVRALPVHQYRQRRRKSASLAPAH